MTQRTIAALMLALGLATLAGCASPTVITLNDGREIQAVDTPKFDKDSGFYEFEQLDGKQTRINNCSPPGGSINSTKPLRRPCLH